MVKEEQLPFGLGKGVEGSEEEAEIDEEENGD